MKTSGKLPLQDLVFDVKKKINSCRLKLLSTTVFDFCRTTGDGWLDVGRNPKPPHQVNVVVVNCSWRSSSMNSEATNAILHCDVGCH